MKHTIFILFATCLFSGNFAIAQLVADSAHVRKNNAWAIKGKILPWTIAASSGVNASLGVEYGFRRVHSVGIDFTYSDYSSANEVRDTGNNQYRSGPRVYTVVRGVFINYRRYVHIDSGCSSRALHKLLKNDYMPYLGAFGRYGKNDLHYEKDYITTQLSYDEWHYSVGILIGVVSGLMDINLGPFYKTKYITDVQQDNGIAFHTHVQSNFGLRVGINFFFIPTKSGRHYLSEYNRE